MSIAALRRHYHTQICQQVIRIQRDGKTEYPNFADGKNRSSSEIAWGIVKLLQYETNYQMIKGQSAGRQFESLTAEFLENTFKLLSHLRPGNWTYSTLQTAISGFEQYEHLAHLENAVKKDRALSTVLGGDYIVKPDIVIARLPVSDDEINRLSEIVSEIYPVAQQTPFRESNLTQSRPILHASISCKWTIRSDRAQNTRTEALNLSRNRKGHLPHIVAVTAEPLPTRLATLALGTGDLDCAYHFALPELQRAILEINNQDQLDMLSMLIEGKRLGDIADLPFDLAT
jgi:hypothetical protein